MTDAESLTGYRPNPASRALREILGGPALHFGQLKNTRSVRFGKFPILLSKGPELREDSTAESCWQRQEECGGFQKGTVRSINACTITIWYTNAVF